MKESNIRQRQGVVGQIMQRTAQAVKPVLLQTLLFRYLLIDGIRRNVCRYGPVEGSVKECNGFGGGHG